MQMLFLSYLITYGFLYVEKILNFIIIKKLFKYLKWFVDCSFRLLLDGMQAVRAILYI